MRKLLLSLFACSFLLLGVARAENSGTAYDRTYGPQQVFVYAYNNNASTININNAVVLDTTPSINPNSNLGAYINTTTTTDSIYIFGVTDENISTGTLGRICIRGPHKVLWQSTTKPAAAGTNSVISNTSTAGTAGPTSTAAGTNHGILGRLLSNTASTDAGDTAGQTYWAWIQPQVEN